MVCTASAIILLGFVVNLIGIQAAPVLSTERVQKGSCGPNERYKCVPSTVETCDSKPTLNSTECQMGCVCKKGYVRQTNATNSTCIKRKKCPTNETTCSEHEEYNSCGSGCPPSCSDLYYNQPEKVCTEQCVAGCFCKEGLYRSQSGPCVPPKKCCKAANEHYSDCGTACPATCTDRDPVCTRQCAIGCFCDTEFFRQDNGTNSRCIEESEC